MHTSPAAQDEPVGRPCAAQSDSVVQQTSGLRLLQAIKNNAPHTSSPLMDLIIFEA